MVLKRMARAFFNWIKHLEAWSEGEAPQSIYGKPLLAGAEAGERAEGGKAYSVWDCLEFRENTQAYHLSNVIGFEEWLDMEEIRRRIKELFGTEYKHGKSLYPYLKTLSDIGLMEITSAGGRRKWRKRFVLVKLVREKTGPKEEEKKRVKAT